MNLILAICPGLCLYVRSYQKKIQDFWSFGLAWPSIFAFTKEFPKNTNEKLPSDHFCSPLRQDDQIDLPSSPDCQIFIAVFENTHIINIFLIKTLNHIRNIEYLWILHTFLLVYFIQTHVYKVVVSCSFLGGWLIIYIVQLFKLDSTFITFIFMSTNIL